MSNEPESTQHKSALQGLKGYLSSQILGQEKLVDRLLIALLADGHLLVEGAPGLAKTKAIKDLAEGLEAEFHRIQFTPDLLPADITGTEIYRPETGTFVFQQGPIFHHLVLADEINRATPRTQSSLLECMEEGQATIDGDTMKVGEPFFVIATQNPVGASGTQLLPDSQLDRFALRLTMGYPAPADELELLQRKLRGDVMDSVSQAVGREELAALRSQVDRVFVDDAILDYILRLVRATRTHPQLAQGASPRAAISVAGLCRARAFLQGRDYVVPDDVGFIWTDAVSHRLVLAASVGDAQRARDIAAEVLGSIRPPRLR